MTHGDYHWKSGFDALFQCDYMGSSEFEWGAVPESLQRIRKAQDIVIQPFELTLKGLIRTVYAVGPRRDIESKLRALMYWAAENRMRAKEHTDFDIAFSGVPLFEGWDMPDTNAWWSLDDDLMWALDESIARDLYRGITGQTI